MKVLSVICARAGSKGVRNKCVKKIGSLMVIEYSIKYSLSLGSNVKTIVSTDSGQIVDYCIKNKIEYILRDKSLCTDEARIDGALADAINRKGRDCDYCSLVYGNIPTRYPLLFKKAVNFLKNNPKFEAVLSMQNVGKYNPLSMFDYNEIELPKVSEVNYRRQALPQKIIHDGHTFIFKCREFMRRFEGKSKYNKKYLYEIFGARIKPIVSDEVIIDIDLIKDFKLASGYLLYSLKHGDKK